MRFVVATLHFAGLGFALRLQDEGHDVLLASAGTADRRLEDRYRLVGEGLLPRMAIAEAMQRRREWKDAIWIWDENHSVLENEQLRAEGFRVFGGGSYPDRMEHDRDACLKLMGEHGLNPPPSFAFAAPDDALRFLEQHPDTAYVYKPDEGDPHDTWLPPSPDGTEANQELRQHLRTLPNGGAFVLQERKDGVETNVEVWFVRGEPVFAFMTLESKHKLTGDLGDLVGCAFDFAFVVPLECRAVRETVGRLFDVYREMRYTGFGDANFIVARDGLWFFEKCERFGYNAHPNLFWNLNRAPLGETFAALLDGSFAPDFAPGFGASVTMYMDHPAPGKAVRFPDAVASRLYLLDVYRQDGQMLTAGYYGEAVLLACGFGYTIPTAWEATLEVAGKVSFPGRSYRLDGASTEIPSSPVRRYEALTAMNYL